MGQQRDYRAEFGSQPTWNRQQRKQEIHGKAANDSHPEVCPDCDKKEIIVIGYQKSECDNCGKRFIND